MPSLHASAVFSREPSIVPSDHVPDRVPNIRHRPAHPFADAILCVVEFETTLSCLTVPFWNAPLHCGPAARTPCSHASSAIRFGASLRFLELSNSLTIRLAKSLRGRVRTPRRAHSPLSPRNSPLGSLAPSFSLRVDSKPCSGGPSSSNQRLDGPSTRSCRFILPKASAANQSSCRRNSHRGIKP